MSEDKPGNLIEQLARLTGQVAGQTLDAAKTTAELTAMFGESWLKSTVLKTLEPERLEALERDVVEAWQTAVDGDGMRYEQEIVLASARA